MRIQTRMYNRTRKNCAVYKEKYFSKDDVITKGYLVGHAFDLFDEQTLDKHIVEEYMMSLTDSDKEGEFTSLSIREQTNTRIGEIKAYLDELWSYKKSFSVNEIIDIVLEFSVNAVSTNIEKENDDWNETELIFIQSAYQLMRKCSVEDTTKRIYLLKALSIIEEGLKKEEVTSDEIKN